MFEFPWLTADLATRICLTLLHSLWQIALLVVIAAAVGRWRRTNVNWNYSTQVAALLIGMLLIPVTFCFVDNPFEDNENITAVAAIEEPLIVVSPVNDSPGLPTAIVTKETQLVEAPAFQQAHLRQSQPHPEEIDAVENPATNFANTPWVATIGETNWWPSLAIGCIVVYAIGVVLMILRLTLLLVRTDRMASSAVAIESGPAFELLDGLAKKWRMKIVPSLMLAEQTITPKVVGLMRPMILLPASAISGLTSNELEMILAHELAHVRRYDLWVNLVQRVAEALLFFNPAMWYLSRRISTIREYCCDELACEAVQGQPDETRVRYANALIRVVELVGTTGSEHVEQLTALAATGRSPSELRQRVARLFGEPLQEPLRLSRGSLAVIAAVIVACLASPFVWDLAAATPPADQPAATVAEEDGSSGESPSFKISGQVIDAEGKGVANASVEGRCLLHLQEVGTVKRQAEADDSGNFVIVVDSDPKTDRHWDFTAKSSSGNQIGFFSHYIGGEKTRVAGLEIEINPAKSATIQVVDAESKPVANASVAAMCDGGAWISQKMKTDDNGRATVIVPKSFRIESVVAWKDDVGLDYQNYTLPRNQRSDLKTQVPEFPVEGETLRLEGTDPVTVQLVDDAGAPIQGARLSPLGLRKAPSERQYFNLFMFERLISQTTDATGQTTFKWMPKWQKSQVIFISGRVRVEYEPTRSERHLKITRNRRVPIRGRVLDEAGNPAAGIAVTARGTGYGYPKDVEATAKSAADGSYEMSVVPEHLYMVLAHDEDRVSDTIPSFVVKPGKPVEVVDLQLRKPTRVTGQLKSESSGKPIGGQTVSVYQYGDDLKSMKGVTLANPKKAWYYSLRPRYVRKVSTDPEGRFELLLGDGSYEIRPLGVFMPKEFQISGEDMISVDVISKQEVTAAQPKKVTLTGTVRHHEDNRPMPNIRVVGVARNSDRNWQARTDANGEFAVKVVSEEVYLHAATEDKSLGAIAKLEAGQNTTNLVLQRTGSVHGVLLQTDSDTPAANQMIMGGIEITSEEPVSYSTAFGSMLATDADGKFSIEGVVPGWEYELVLINQPDGSTPQVATVKVEPGQNTDLGKLTIPALRKRYVPPTLDERSARPVGATDTNQITEDEPGDITPSQLMAQLKERDAQFARSNIRFHRTWSSEVIASIELGRAQFNDMKFGSKRRSKYSDINLEFHTPYSKLRETAVLMTTNDRSFQIENRENKTTYTEVETGLRKILGSSYFMVMSQDSDGRCVTNSSKIEVDPPLPKSSYDDFSFESNRTYLAFASGYGIGQQIVSIESVKRDGDLTVAEGCVIQNYPTHGGHPREAEKWKNLATGHITFTKDLIVREATLKSSRLEMQADGSFKDITNAKHTPNQQDAEFRIRIETTGLQQFDGLPALPVSGYASLEIQYNNDGKWHSYNNTGCQVAIVDASAGSDVPARMRTKMDNATWKPEPVSDPGDQYSPQPDSFGKLTDDGEFFEFPFTEEGIADALRGRSKILARGKKESSAIWFPKNGEDSVVEEDLCQKFAELLLPELKRFNAKVRVRKSTDELQFFVPDQHVWQVDRIVVQAFESLRQHRN